MRWSEDQLADHQKKRAAQTAAAPSMADAPFHAAPSNGQDPVTISLRGNPQGKGRARAYRRGDHIAHYTPEKTRTYEGIIATAAALEMRNRPPFNEPVELFMRAVFPIPQSWSTKKKDSALIGAIKPGTKPDLDNICKAWQDALNGVVYRDDSLICRMTLEKRYGPHPLVVVTVRPLP